MARALACGLGLLFSLSVSSASASASAAPSFLVILGDDIGWADFRYANGTARTPRLSQWLAAPGSILLQDFHSGGTVCSPTRATILTGRNHFRDCVNYVYGCSDMTECVPDFEFAPQHTFTIADAVRSAGRNYTSTYIGKWHLGSFYNDSEALGGITSSPISHGFDEQEATVEVAPTATLNCDCNAAWQADCNFGHNEVESHCYGTQGPDPNAPAGCCFNYWHRNDSAPHGVSNYTLPTPDDDAAFNAAAFVRFAEARGGAPFFAQLSFHNCHIPFVGTKERVAACNSSTSGGDDCLPPLPGALPYNFQELDYYACLNELDNSVGTVIDALKRIGYYNNTLVLLTTDNGPEINCLPEGRCGSGTTGHIPPGTLHRPACDGAGSAGPLRGRKRDVWEGGHRVPGILSWPAVVQGGPRVSWDPLVTMDIHATIMDVLGVERPTAQQHWGYDGVSFMPLLRNETLAERGIGWMFNVPDATPENGYAFRYGPWKYVAGGISCGPEATFNCSLPQLYDMRVDIAEEHDLAAQRPEVLADLAGRFRAWFASVHNSIVNESHCATVPPAPIPFPPKPLPSTNCTLLQGKALNGTDLATGTTASVAECCGACVATPECVASDYVPASPARPTWRGEMSGGTCHLKAAFLPRTDTPATRVAAHVVGRS